MRHVGLPHSVAAAFVALPPVALPPVAAPPPSASLSARFVPRPLRDAAGLCPAHPRFPFTAPPHFVVALALSSPHHDMARTKRRAPGPGPGGPPQFKPARRKFYAVRHGRNGVSGIFESWDQCKALVHGVRGAVHKSFSSRDEAQHYLEARPRRSATAATAATAAAAAAAPPPPLQTQAEAVAAAAAQAAASPLYVVDRDPFSFDDVADRAPAAAYRAPVAHTAHHPVVASVDDPAIPTPEQLAAAAPEPCPEAPAQRSVYTDGACEGNGKSHARAGYGVYFGEESPYNVSERLQGGQTNQRAEMTAALEAMRVVLDHGLVARGGMLLIHSDSKYTINGIDSWIHNWKRNNWKTQGSSAVKNKELWMEMDATRQALAKKGIKVTFNWVKGHAGIHGNEVADRLAVAGLRDQT